MRFLMAAVCCLSLGCSTVSIAVPSALGHLRSPADTRPVARVRQPADGEVVIVPSLDPSRPPVVSPLGRGDCYSTPAGEARYTHDVAVTFSVRYPGVYGIRFFVTANGTSRIVAEGTVAADRGLEMFCGLHYPAGERATFDLIEVAELRLVCSDAEGTCSIVGASSFMTEVHVSEPGVNRRTEPDPDQIGLHRSIVLP